MDLSEDYYRKKYIKYKALYLELVEREARLKDRISRENQKGGGRLTSE